MKNIFSMFLFGVLMLVFIIWYSNVGTENLYYIEEVNMYIKTFPSRETSIIAFSNKRIDNFEDSLDYIIVNKGDDYYTDFFFNYENKDIIYSRNNSVKNICLDKYKIKDVFFNDTTYYIPKGYGRYLLKPIYTGCAIRIWGSTERFSLKNRNDTTYMKIEPIK